MISVVQHHQSIFSASFSRRCYANLKQWMLSQIMICSSWMKTMLSQLNICLMILIMTSELCASCCSSGWQESTWSSRTRSAMSRHIVAGSDCQAHEVVKYLFVTMNMCFSLMKIMLSQLNIFLEFDDFHHNIWTLCLFVELDGLCKLARERNLCKRPPDRTTVPAMPASISSARASAMPRSCNNECYHKFTLASVWWKRFITN